MAITSITRATCENCGHIDEYAWGAPALPASERPVILSLSPLRLSWDSGHQSNLVEVTLCRKCLGELLELFPEIACQIITED
jgi:hypothetical protein